MFSIANSNNNVWVVTNSFNLFDPKINLSYQLLSPGAAAAKTSFVVQHYTSNVTVTKDEYKKLDTKRCAEL